MCDEEDLLKINKALKEYKEENEFICDEFINYDDENEDEDLEEDSDTNELVIADLNNLELTTISTYSLTNLKPNEKTIIDNCVDPELKNLLILNRRKYISLVEFYNKAKNILYVTQSNIKSKCASIKERVNVKADSKFFPLTKLGAPYFKDTQLYPCPQNSDVLKKQKNNELTIYDLNTTIKWRETECMNLKGAVKTNYSINMQKHLAQQINNFDGDANALNDLKQKLKYFETNDNIIPPQNSNDFIDWNRIADVFMNNKHSALECRSFWHIYLHPAINKSPWSQEEIQQLTNIVQKKSNRMENWDEIATELNTNRTAFTVAYHYFSSLHKKYKRGEFTKQEDKLLRDLVERFKRGNYIQWNKVSERFKNRSRHQLFYRYTYYLTTPTLNRNRFSEAEDILLLILVGKFGKNFTKCAKYFPGRSQVQLKSRYNANLVKALKKGSFTKEEDQVIWEFVSANENNANKWSHLAKILDRCRGQIRQRYNIIKQYLDGGIDRKLEDVPSRRHAGGSSENERCYGFLRHTADKFKNLNTIPTLTAIENFMKNDNQSIDAEGNGNDNEFNTIDDMLTDFFFNSIKLGPSIKSINDKNLNEVTNNVQIILDLLQVNFILPKNYHDNPHLDGLDKKILENLAGTQNKIKNKNKPIVICYKNKQFNDICPPNLNTLIGLRSLLINHRLYKQNTKHYLTEISWNVEKYIKNMSTLQKTRFKVESDLFFKRFKALFKWPSILTLNKPNVSLLNSIKDGNKTKTRTYSSKKRSLSHTDMKICKIPKIIEMDVSVPSTSDNSGLNELSDLEKLQRILSTQNDLSDDSDNESDCSEVITGL